MDIQEFNIKGYLHLVNNYFNKHGKTSSIHINSLIIIYRFTRDERIFNMIYKTHKFLLMKIVQNKYNQYKRFLYNDDFIELECMLNGEFYRRVMFYKIPPEAPFSGYIKIYLNQWLNAYVKIMVTKNKRTILNIDYINEEEDEHM